MIVPKRPQVWRMVQYVGLPLLFLFVWDVLIVLAYNLLHWQWLAFSSVPLALYGSVIGLIVGFRNNSAYARWWEARTLWGQIVNNSRSLARQVCASFEMIEKQMGESATGAGEFKRKLIYHQIAFVHALRQQLRGLDPLLEIRGLLDPEAATALDKQKNVALALQLSMGTMLRHARRQDWIDNFEWQAMDRNLDDLADAQGGAERLKNTPLPKQYDYFPMLFVHIYCLLLPIGMVENLGWFTPLGSTLVGFMFLALDKIGRDLEDPFDNTIFDVPITAICRTIEINLRQMLGEQDLPAAEVPIKGVLW